MKQVVYAMQFKGSAAPKAGVSGMIKASTTAGSCMLSSVVGPDGLTGILLPAQRKSIVRVGSNADRRHVLQRDRHDSLRRFESLAPLQHRRARLPRQKP